jgi:hypothetical protein
MSGISQRTERKKGEKESSINTDKRKKEGKECMP